MKDEILTVKQLAAYLQLNEMTIYKLAREGKIPASRIGRSWRFKKDLIDDWLARGGAIQRAELIFRDETERRYPLTSSTILLGADPANDIVLSKDSQISARHAMITLEREGFVIVNLDGKTGTYVNGVAIDRQVLQDGDEIRLGDTILIFRML